MNYPQDVLEVIRIHLLLLYLRRHRSMSLIKVFKVPKKLTTLEIGLYKLRNYSK